TATSTDTNYDGVTINAVTADITDNDTANTAPVVSNAIADTTATVSEAFSLTLSTDTFTDADGDALTYTATLEDGSVLPPWLSFDAATGTFSGTPTDTDIGTLTVQVTADDGTESVSDRFTLTVNDITPDPVPTLSAPPRVPFAPDNTLLNDEMVSDSIAQTFEDFCNLTPPAVSPNADATPLDNLIGTTAPDEITAAGDNTFTQGLQGNDNLYGSEGNNTIHGNQGTDYIEAGAGDDLVHGGKDD
ncbi:putative Ig domain-containing protein, partial [Phormidium sp. CCY1219]|uniref:putative Ig domain-containing protein n=1 Tax=Phormidium sp. CCY1219 TaxID=2886104 RepID=UPI002D1E9892